MARYRDCMATIQIRNLSESAYRTLRLRAAEKGQSLQEYLRVMLEAQTASPTIDQILNEVRNTATARFSNQDVLDAMDAGRNDR